MFQRFSSAISSSNYESKLGRRNRRAGGKLFGLEQAIAF